MRSARCRDRSQLVMPGLDPGIHVFLSAGSKQAVDGRVKPGHDDLFRVAAVHHLWISVPVPWLVNNSSRTACRILPSMMTTPCTPCSSA